MDKAGFATYVQKLTISCGTVPNTYAGNVTYRDIGKLTALKLDALTVTILDTKVLIVHKPKLTMTNTPIVIHDTDYNDHHGNGNELITTSKDTVTQASVQHEDQSRDEVMDISQTKDTKDTKLPIISTATIEPLKFLNRLSEHCPLVRGIQNSSTEEKDVPSEYQQSEEFHTLGTVKSRNND
ncbi:hypothetical protein BSL78_25114 [Apostichopus japonicus]|uniref:Uncharacterized protein n=1 Tax=Stichopus japonicus TaxID=307972 RepID=A0A2G8JQL6_STIJA|nr:hypothetical protein BSL78_25114 [Apostichopus japonicus]